jgi:hypothetical protein
MPNNSACTQSPIQWVAIKFNNYNEKKELHEFLASLGFTRSDLSSEWSSGYYRLRDIQTYPHLKNGGMEALRKLTDNAALAKYLILETEEKELFPQIPQVQMYLKRLNR